MEKEFPYKDLSYKLVGCFYDVYNEIGPEHKEQVYHKALQIVFNDQGIICESKPRLPIIFRGQQIGIYEPDFLVEEKIVLEIKSTNMMIKVFEQQLYTYIK